MIVDILVILGSWTDLFLTYKLLGIYKSKFPKQNWLAIESNPLIRFCVRHKGLGEGMIISAIIITTLFLGLLHIVGENFKFFVLGVLYMMNTYHLLNYLKLKGGIKNVRKKQTEKRNKK